VIRKLSVSLCVFVRRSAADRTSVEIYARAS
jgi:hypothetical protein